MVMASCSKNIDTAESGKNDWVLDVNLPVPLQLGTGVFTRAAIASEADMLGKGFGFFAVDKYATDLTADNGIELPDNVKATCSLIEDGTKVEFQFVNGNNAPVSYYYPLMNTKYYSFYGYHAHQADAADVPASKKTSTRITVDVPVSKQLDILHGEAVVTDPQQGSNGMMYDGYNAAYVRKVGKPLMNFKHVTARVSLQTTMATGQDGKDGISIAQIGVSEVPTSATLCIVDIENPALNGTFLGNNGTTNDAGNPRFSAIPNTNLGILTTTTVALTEDVFLAPQTTPLKVKIIYNVVKNGVAVNPQKEIVYELDPSKFNNARQGFEAGYHYTFNLVFYSPEEIRIEATIEDYTNAFDNIEGGVAVVDPDSVI